MSIDDVRNSNNDIVSLVCGLNRGRVSCFYQKIFLGILSGGNRSGGRDTDRKLYRTGLFRSILADFVGNWIRYGKYPCVDSRSPI